MSESEKVPVKELLKLIELGKVREPELDKFIDKLQEFADPRLQVAIKTTESNMQRFFNSFADAGKSLWEEGGFKEAFNKILLGTKWLTNRNSPLLYIGRMFTNILAGLTKSALDRFAKFADLMVKFKVFKDPTKTGEYFSLNDDWDKGFMDFINKEFPQFSEVVKNFFDAEGLDKIKAFGKILSKIWDEALGKSSGFTGETLKALTNLLSLLNTFLENFNAVAGTVIKEANAYADARKEARRAYWERSPEQIRYDMFEEELKKQANEGQSGWAKTLHGTNRPLDAFDDLGKATIATNEALKKDLVYQTLGMFGKLSMFQPTNMSPVAKSIIEIKLQLNDNALDVMMAKITGDLVSTITTK